MFEQFDEIFDSHKSGLFELLTRQPTYDLIRQAVTLAQYIPPSDIIVHTLAFGDIHYYLATDKRHVHAGNSLL